MRSADEARQAGAARASELRFSIGASVFRLIAGFTIVSVYLCGYQARHHLFDTGRAWPWDAVLPAWSPWFAELAFHLGLLAAGLWLLGWRTRWTTALTCLSWWLLRPRVPTFLEGAGDLLGLVLVYAIFADVGAHFSLDARRRGRDQPRARARIPDTLHDAAIVAFAAQLGIVYALAGLDMLRRHVSLLPGLDRATLLFLLTFPLLVLVHRYTRLLAVGLAVMFHAGLALFHGLVTPSLLMTAVSATLVDDDAYRAIGRALARLARSLRGPRADPDDAGLDGATVPSDWR